MLDYEKFQKIHDFFVQGRDNHALHLLMQIQAQHITLLDTIDILKARIQEFEEILFLSEALYFEEPFYWLRTAKETQGPFCPHCYEGDTLLFRLRKRHDIFYCEHCGAKYRCNTHDGNGMPHRIPSAKLIPFHRPSEKQGVVRQR